MPKAGPCLPTLSSPESQGAGGGVESRAAAPRPPRSMPTRQKESGKPRGKTCRWTTELDELLTAAWTQGGICVASREIQKLQPAWSSSSIRKRAAKLGLSRAKAQPWSDADEHHLLWSIDSNASLALIAQRLGRSVAAVRKRLWNLGYKAESLGGFKVKEVAEMLSVLPDRVRNWVKSGLLLTKGGRITEASLSKFLAHHPSRIPFETLSSDMQSWLREMGYAGLADPTPLQPPDSS